MSGTPLQRIESALEALAGRAGQDPRLRAEAARARREFFGPNGTWFPGDAVAQAAAERRFREWYLLERDSEVLGAPLRQVMAEADPAGVLEESVVGVFTVERIRKHSVDVRDLQGNQLREVVLPGQELQVGDVLVGRMYLLEDGSEVPSPAIAYYRPGGPLAAAFRRDLQRLDLDRRLSQAELEHLLMAGSARAAAAAAVTAPERPLEHLEAELEAVLRAGHCNWSAAEISKRLAGAERLGPVMGPILEQLAFDTSVDLDRARQCLLAVWNAQQAEREQRPEPGPAAPKTAAPAGGETLGQTLVRALDQGLAEHRDVEQLFRQLEDLAGIEPEGEEEETAEAEDNPDLGDLQALVTEFLWEGGEATQVHAPTLQLWVQLQRNASVPRTDLEQITGLDLMRVLLHVYLAAAPSGRSGAVRTAFAALEAFYRWADETQGCELSATLQQCRGALLDDLDRLQQAGVQLSTEESSPDARPCLMYVESVGKKGFGVRPDGGDPAWIAAAPPVLALLRPGNLLLGALERTGQQARLQGLVVALPPDAESLVG
jgi:hypothetical protein